MRIGSNTLQKLRRFIWREEGMQIVELAIALPVMLMLLGSVAEFGRFFYTYTTLTNAVRGGARHACKWERNASWTFPETSTMVVYGDFSDTSHGPILPGLTTRRRGRGADTASDGRRISLRQSWHHGLRPDEKCAGRYFDA